MILTLALSACAAPVAAPAADEGAGETAAEPAESGEAAMEEGDVTLRLGWWGNEPRHNMYNDLADMYEELNPNVTIEREFAGWAPYWEKLATQVAGGNAPDIIHMHPNYLFDYGNRGALLDLTPLVETGQIDLSKWPQGIVDTGKIDDKIYMLTLGNSSVGIHYNPALFEQAGVAEPDHRVDVGRMDWQDTVLALNEALPEDVYAIRTSGDDARGFRVFLRQRDKLFFDGDSARFRAGRLARLLADVGRPARRRRHAARRTHAGNEPTGSRGLHVGEGAGRRPGYIRQPAQALPGAHGERAGPESLPTQQQPG